MNTKAKILNRFFIIIILRFLFVFFGQNIAKRLSFELFANFVTAYFPSNIKILAKCELTTKFAIARTAVMLRYFVKRVPNLN
jgi:hypothetical protein